MRKIIRETKRTRFFDQTRSKPFCIAQRKPPEFYVSKKLCAKDANRNYVFETALRTDETLAGTVSGKRTLIRRPSRSNPTTPSIRANSV